jgi:hypothetical protein
MPNARDDHAGNDPAGKMTKSVQAGLATALSLPRKAAEANFEAASVLLGFISRRMKAQAEFFGGLSRCKDFTSAVEMHRGFWGHVSDDVSKETSQFSDIAKTDGTGIAKPVAESAPEGAVGVKTA